VENMGTGINKIRSLMQGAKVKPPKFEFGDFYSIIFQRESETTEEQRNKDGVDTELIRNDVGETSEKRRSNVGETSEKILKLINENRSITIAVISEKIGITTRSVERNIKKLKELSLLKRIGSDKGGYWQVIDNDK